MPMINFRAPEDLAAQLRARATAEHVSLSAIVRDAVQAHLDAAGTDTAAAPPPEQRHLHRFAATGAFRHEQGQRIDERRCACGEVTWS